MVEFPSLRLRLALWAYSVLWVLLLPLVLVYLWHRGRRDTDYISHLAERFGVYRTPMRNAVWVHAVSLGELRSAVPLIRALLGQGECVVITHFTPAGRRESSRVFATEIAAGTVGVVWVPFELGPCFSGFFKSFEPKYGLVMEIEIWPRMIMAARKAGVPLFMCNAQYPSKSILKDKGWRWWRPEVMRGFAGALVKSDIQAERFAQIGLKNIVVTGELRFDQPIPAAQVNAGRAQKPNRPVVAIASAVEGEDAGYIEVIKALSMRARENSAVRTLIIYVPRKPERFEEVGHMLEQEGFIVGRRSKLLDVDLKGKLPETLDVLLGDSLGEMYFYLSLADRVVVGGGFTPKGAHNIIEPLALKKPVLVGPEVWTIEYPFTEAKMADVARSVPDFASLADALISPQDPDDAKIEEFFRAHSGATRRTLAGIEQLLTSR